MASYKLREWLKRIKRGIAWTTDTHVGSEFALWPEGFILNVGRPEIERMVYLNPIQEAMLGYWRRFWEVCDQWQIDTIFDLADTCDGKNKFGGGVGQITTDINEQALAAIDLYRPYLAGRKYFNVSGSDYHEALDVKIHQFIASEIEKFASESTYLGIVANVQLEDTDIIANVAHGGGFGGKYDATNMQTTEEDNLIASAMGKLPHADIVLRGHDHRWRHLHSESGHFIRLPCWQAYRPIKKYIKGYHRHQPSLGGAIMLIDEDDRITVHHHLYPNPMQGMGLLPV